MPVRVEDLVGRGPELAALAGALPGTGTGTGPPAAVVVSGEPGIGKTALLGALTTLAQGRGHLVLAGSATELERDLPFSVFVDALDRHLDDLDPVLAAGTRTELAGLLPALSDPDVHNGAPLQYERYRAHRAVRDLLELLAAPTPLLLVLDDLHWADPASVELLSALLRRPPAAPVLLALGLRPAQAPARLAAALHGAHRVGAVLLLEPAPLDLHEARQLLGPALSGAVVDELYRRSGGNPFYLEQLARSAGSTAAGRAPGGRASGGRAPGGRAPAGSAPAGSALA